MAAWPAIRMAGAVLHGMLPNIIVSVETHGHLVEVVTTLRPAVADLPPEMQGELVLDINPLVFGYGLPLLLALFLATDGARSAWKLALAALILTPFQAWGICFAALQQIYISNGPDVAAQAGNIAAWQRDAVALGWQFGSLIFPPLVPVVLWLAFNRKFLGAVLIEGLLNRDAGRL